MATQIQVNAFIKQIAPLVQRFAKQYGYHVASPIIAMACIESAYGTSPSGSHNYFGMKCGTVWKGKSVNVKTGEFYNGQYVTIRDNFRCYDSFEEGVEGFFKFINWSNYANLKMATTPKMFLEMIVADHYCTSPTYVTNCMSIINQYKLTQFDDFSNKTTYVAPNPTPVAPSTPSKNATSDEVSRLAREVMQGKWGNYPERKRRLTQAGYDYGTIQREVDRIMLKK